jgi:hypothetical protein
MKRHDAAAPGILKLPTQQRDDAAELARELPGVLAWRCFLPAQIFDAADSPPEM